eukprot:jgi/Phyca11/115784/e_gw1.29.414.1
MEVKKDYVAIHPVCLVRSRKSGRRCWRPGFLCTILHGASSALRNTTRSQGGARLTQNSRFALINNNSVTKRLWCTSHLDCTAEARIKLDPDGKFRLTRSGVHTTTPAPLASQRTGIHKPLLPEIDNLLLGGQGPQTCLNELKARYAGSDSVLALLPSVGQLKNRAHRLRRSGDFDITSYADIMVWAAPRLCSSPATFFGKMRYKPQSDAQRWTLVSFGTYGLRFTSMLKYQHKFYPIAFMFVKTETAVSRSKEQFEALSELITQNWSDLGEDEYATWLDNEYLTDTWNLWFCTASDAPGIVPNQNPIESHHNTIKTTAVKQLLCFYRSCSSIYATKNYSAMC